MFGNLVYDFSLKKVKNHLEIISEEDSYLRGTIEKQTYPVVALKKESWFRSQRR